MDRSQEEHRLEQVKALILRQIQMLTKELAVHRGGVTEARREMWAETPIIRDFDDVANLSSMFESVSMRERQYSGVSLRLNNLKRMLESPYFGRVDFIEEGYDDTEEIYIGGQSLFDEDSHQYYIYDWRAPISSMYYDYGIGPASFKAPDGFINGTITLKRQYHIEKGCLSYLFDSDIKIDDDILQMELSKASDAKIKTIIHSIQRDQNRAIRCDADHIIVFGPAGSGKTSVGLHRLAYLLYRHRGSLTSARVRIFSSNNIFSSYIAGIIPELGEEDVLTLDFKTLLKTYGPTERAFTDAYEQIDYLTRTDGEASQRRESLRMKYDPLFAQYAAGFVKRYLPSVADDARFNADIVCARERIIALYEDRTAVGNQASKTSRVLEYVNRCYSEYFRENKKAITDFFNDLHDENFSDGEIRAKFDEQRGIVLQDLKSRLLPDPKKLYEKIVRAYVNENGLDKSVIRFTSKSLRRDSLWYEDALVLFYIDILTGRIKKDRNVKHILVDEAQDISYLQHVILLGLFENCHFTVLADMNQALYPDISLRDKALLPKIYDEHADIIELTKSYRSTYQISRFAAGLIGCFDEDMFFKRMGEEPEIIATDNLADCTAQILKTLPSHFNTVGILFSDSRAARSFYAALKNIHKRAVLIASAEDDFRPGVMVMAVPFAKGLEFDAVIVPEYGSPAFEGETGRRVLYLICTRALHRLYLLKLNTH